MDRVKTFSRKFHHPDLMKQSPSPTWVAENGQKLGKYGVKRMETHTGNHGDGTNRADSPLARHISVTQLNNQKWRQRTVGSYSKRLFLGAVIGRRPRVCLARGSPTNLSLYEWKKKKQTTLSIGFCGSDPVGNIVFWVSANMRLRVSWRRYNFSVILFSTRTQYIPINEKTLRMNYIIYNTGITICDQLTMVVTDTSEVVL